VFCRKSRENPTSEWDAALQSTDWPWGMLTSVCCRMEDCQSISDWITASTLAAGTGAGTGSELQCSLRSLTKVVLSAR